MHFDERESASQLLQHRGLQLHCASGVASANGVMLTLTRAEFAVLVALLRRRGTPLSRAVIVEEIAATGLRVDGAMVDISVLRLRRKLAAHGLDGVIATAWGRGYLVASERAEEAMAPEEGGMVVHMPVCA